MPETPETTRPRPFVFVLMPFDKAFDDVYKLGIKAAAEKAGAYAERVDEQIFTEGILERVFNQINKADVLIADMTDRNANVFYEVGYAHALGRTVLLLTKRVEDIPFDLQHRPHIIYGDSIADLKEKLTARIEWAISNGSEGKKPNSYDPLSLSIDGIPIPCRPTDKAPPHVTVTQNPLRTGASLALHFVNTSVRPSQEVPFLYLMGKNGTYVTHIVGETSGLNIEAIKLPSKIAEDGYERVFKIAEGIAALPPRAFDAVRLTLANGRGFPPMHSEAMRLRMQTTDATFDFDFVADLS